MQDSSAVNEHPPIRESDTSIAKALEDARLVPLIMSIVHLTGDASLLDQFSVEGVTIQNMDGSLSDDDKAVIRARALAALSAYRDGAPLPPPPGEALLQRMIDFIAARSVTSDYTAMLKDDLGLGGAWHFRWSDGAPPKAAADFHTLVIGAGMSGLLQAHRLSEAGLPFVIVEKNDDVGGTWYENRYPGCRVDSSNHFYSYSFEPNVDWSEHYSQRDELHAYFRRCAERFGLQDHIRFNTETVAARYDEEDALWHVTLRTADGGEETLRVNAIVSAVGQLNRPKIPDFPGRERFRGPAFHAAQWEDGHRLEGKRIAVVGAGATAFQLIPEIAKIASHLVCFQRSPGWMAPNAGYHSAVEDGLKWCMRHIPYYRRWYRFCLFWGAADATLPTYTIDPEWTEPDRSINATNAKQRELLSQSILHQLRDRPDLAEKIVPPYPPGGKRLLQDNGHYLRALMRDNVEVVADGISEIDETGIVDGQGRRHEVDVILYATGFHANKFLWPMRIEGKGGKLLNEVWGDTPRAYLGITVPDFPNLFCLYGPGTNLAHGGSIIFHAECQVRYVMGCIKLMVEDRIASLDVKPAVYEDYVARLEATLARMVWSHPGVSSWYKNARGLVVNTSPWRLVDYWNWTQAPNPDDYLLGERAKVPA
jgi:4-hydroxyacetophenone monooxygenase